MKANSNYILKNNLTNSKAKTLILVGSRERPIMKKSANLIQSMIPDSEIEILKGYYHGDFSINHANEYVNKLKKLVR